MPVLSRAAIALALTVCPAPLLAQETALKDIPERLLRAGEAAVSGECRTALQLIAEELRRNSAIPEDVHNATLETAANCAGETGNFDLAYKYAVAGTKLYRSSDRLWRLRLQLELQANRDDLALSTVHTLANGRGAALNSMPSEIFTAWDAGLKLKKDELTRRSLFTVLTSNSYQPQDSVTVVDEFRREYVDLLIRAGATGAAATVVGEIENPSTRMAVSLDPRLRGIIPTNLDPRVAATSLAPSPTLAKR